MISVLTPTIRPAGLEITRKCLMEQTYTSFEWLVEVGTGKHDLNAAYNRMLRRAKGELVVSLQDFTMVRPDFLQKWLDTYTKYPNAFITAPVGKVDNLDFTGDIQWDWRAHRDSDTETVRECKWDCWEIDNGAAPLSALKQIGGFDEALDGKWSADNVNVGKRAQLAGFEFKCLFDNPGVAFDHDAFIPHPYRETYDPTFNNKRMAMFEGGMTLPRLY